MKKSVRLALACVVASTFALTFATFPLVAQTLTTIYSFQPIGGSATLGGLLADSSGNLFGVAATGGTYGFGTIYELSPTGGGAWSETVLYNFTGGTDGGSPNYSLTSDAQRNLYGVATYGGLGSFDYGTVFQLVPPTSSGGSWTYNVIYSFSGPTTGSRPSTRLVFDKEGRLYGGLFFGGQVCRNSQGGQVFELSPPATAGGSWAESVVYSFPCTSAPSGLTYDGRNHLFGSITFGTGKASGGGVFGITLPPSGQSGWTFTTLYLFGGVPDGAMPMGDLALDKNGNLYGTTYSGGSGFGTVYELSPPASAGSLWAETQLTAFNGANGSSLVAPLVLDGDGNLYGTTMAGGTDNFGTVFQLQPPVSGTGAWTLNQLHDFTSSSADQGYPNTGLIFGRLGLLYGATEGAAFGQHGSVFRIAP